MFYNAFNNNTEPRFTVMNPNVSESTLCGLSGVPLHFGKLLLTFIGVLFLTARILRCMGLY